MKDFINFKEHKIISCLKIVCQKVAHVMENKIAIILGKYVFMNFKLHVKFHKSIFTLKKKLQRKGCE